jgi:hypothetical protein
MATSRSGPSAVSIEGGAGTDDGADVDRTQQHAKDHARSDCVRRVRAVPTRLDALVHRGTIVDVSDRVVLWCKHLEFGSLSSWNDSVGTAVQALMKASKSTLMVDASVVGIPCGKPL